MKVRSILGLLGLTVPLLGCVSTEDLVTHSIKRSPSFRRLIETHADATFAVEERGPRFTIVVIGYNGPSGFVQKARLRVDSRGAVEREVPDIHVGSAWIPDKLWNRWGRSSPEPTAKH